MFQPVRKKIAMHIGLCRNCQKCELHQLTINKSILRGTGWSVKHPYVFVSGHPDGTEDLIGQPVVGNSGNILDIAIREVGIKDLECLVVNSVMCTPYTDQSRLATRNPTKHEVKSCSTNLERFFTLVTPRAVFALGKRAEAALKLINIPHCPVAHPDTILKQGGTSSVEYSRFILQLKKEIRNAKTESKVS